MTPDQLGECFKEDLRDRLTIVYADRDGEVTTRTIEVREVWGKRGDVRGYAWVNWLYAWCELRQDMRHFNARNIQSIEEPGTRFDIKGDRVQEWLADRYEILKRRKRAPKAQAAPARQPQWSTTVTEHVSQQRPAPRRPPATRRGLGGPLLLAAALIIGVLVLASRGNEANLKTTRHVSMPPAAPPPPGPWLPALLRGEAFWIGIGAACTATEDKPPDLYAAIEAAISSRLPEDVRNQARIGITDGINTAYARYSDTVCERGLQALGGR